FNGMTTTQRRLRVHRLFTASSPHQGAVRAEQLPPVLHMQRDMTAGSDFYRELEQAESRAVGYELVPYVRLGDDVVGAPYAAPTLARAGVPPPPPRDMPGDTLGRTRTRWLGPYVSATTREMGERSTATAVVWLAPDGKIRREVSGPMVEAGPDLVIEAGDPYT